jgi:AraC-like DNA-binding protein
VLNTRQRVEVCSPVAHPLTPLRHDFAGSFEIGMHVHPEHQLMFASKGIVTVWTHAGSWVVPPQRAVWIPARTEHRVSIHGAVSMRTLYMKKSLAPRLPSRCCVINVSPLLRELVLHLCSFPGLTPRRKAEGRLISLLFDQLEIMNVAPLQLLYPSDPRGARVAEILTKDPGHPASLESICRSAGASKRTVERIFRGETHMTLGRWRQQLRLLHALQRLSSGSKISQVASDLGYSTASSFISMFRKSLGTTPRQYFSARQA